MWFRIFYVALTAFPRLQAVPRLPARQSNILLEPTTPASRTSFVSNGVAAQQIVGWTKQKHALNQQQQQWSIAYSCDDFFDSL
jgi:hypothetical protein